jgi:hypothetical protein
MNENMLIDAGDGNLSGWMVRVQDKHSQSFQLLQKYTRTNKVTDKLNWHNYHVCSFAKNEYVLQSDNDP